MKWLAQPWLMMRRLLMAWLCPHLQPKSRLLPHLVVTWLDLISSFLINKSHLCLSFWLVAAANERDLFNLVLTGIKAHASGVVPVGTPVTADPLNFLLRRIPLGSGFLTLLANLLTLMLERVVKHHLISRLVLIGNLKLFNPFVDFLIIQATFPMPIVKCLASLYFAGHVVVLIFKASLSTILVLKFFP